MNISVKGYIYAALGFLTPWADFLASNIDITSRAIAATSVASFVSALIAFKAWLSEAPPINK